MAERRSLGFRSRSNGRSFVSMPTYLFYPRRADGVSLTFIAEAASASWPAA